MNQANNRIITNAEDKAGDLQSKTGSLMFPDDLWDCESYADHKALKQNLGITGRILHILVLQRDDPNFRNIPNTDIPYTYPVCVDKGMAGAYLGRYGWVTNHPIGDAIIVTSNPRVEKKKMAKKAEEAKAKAELEPEVPEQLEW